MIEKNDKLTLYNISDEMQILDDMLDANGGEITADLEQKLGAIEAFLTKKVDGCCGYRQRELDLIAAADAYIERLQAFKKAHTNRLANFETYIKLCLEKTGRESFKGELYEIKTRKPSEVLEIRDETQVPAEFIELVETIKIDKAGLKKAVKSGRVVADGISIVQGKTSVSFNLKTESRKKQAKGELNESIESDREGRQVDSDI